MSSLPPIRNISAPLSNPELRDDAACQADAHQTLDVALLHDVYHRPTAWQRLHKAVLPRRKEPPAPSYMRHSQRVLAQREAEPQGPLHKLARACDKLFGRAT